MNMIVYVCFEEKDHYLHHTDDMEVFSERADVIYRLCQNVRTASSSGWQVAYTHNDDWISFDISMSMKDLDSRGYTEVDMVCGNNEISFCCARKEIAE